MALDASQKEKMFQAEMLNHRLTQIEGDIAQMVRQLGEIADLRKALSQFENVSEGTEVLAPLATGIYAKVTATKDKKLLVNVGQGVVVPRSVEEAQAMIAAQEERLQMVRTEAEKAFEETLRGLQNLQKEFENA